MKTSLRQVIHTTHGAISLLEQTLTELHLSISSATVVTITTATRATIISRQDTMTRRLVDS